MFAYSLVSPLEFPVISDQFCASDQPPGQDAADQVVHAIRLKGTPNYLYCSLFLGFVWWFDSIPALFSGFDSGETQEKARIVRELTSTVLSRPPKSCNFIEWKDQKVVYKRYASLYFVAGIDASDNELIVLEQIHLFVEVLDRYFGNVRSSFCCFLYLVVVLFCLALDCV